MDLQMRVRLKSSQLMVRHVALLTCLDANLQKNNTRGILLTFVIIPFVSGYVMRRIQYGHSYARYLSWWRALSPLAQLLKSD